MNPLLARLQHEVVHVVADRAQWFESCLTAISRHPRADDFTAPYSLNDDEDFWPAPNDWRADHRPYKVKNGTLTIPVQGVLLNKVPWQVGNYVTGYPYIDKALQRGLADESVKRIAFNIDSPGGEAAGNLECADRIFAARGSKPMRAFAHERAFSAAYAIASAADDISMTRMGGVGSIGVYAMHIDVSKALEQDGIKVTFIKFGAHKTDGNPFEKLSARAKGREQQRIDRLGTTFVSLVARNREVEAQVVIDTQADCYGPEEAIELGLADRVEIAEEALASFDSDQQGAEMTTKTYTQAELDAALAASQAENTRAVEQAATAAATAAGKAAKDRMTAILASEPAKKRPKAALACVQDTDLTVEQATAFLAKIEEEKVELPAAPGKQQKGAAGALFQAAMGNTEHPDVGAGGEGDQKQTDEQSLAEAILHDHTAATGFGQQKKAA